MGFAWTDWQTSDCRVAKFQNVKWKSGPLPLSWKDDTFSLQVLPFMSSWHRGWVRTSSNSLKGRELANPAFWTQQKSGWAFSNSQRNLDSLWFLFLPPSLFLCLTPDYYPNSPAKKILSDELYWKFGKFFPDKTPIAFFCLSWKNQELHMSWNRMCGTSEGWILKVYSSSVEGGECLMIGGLKDVIRCNIKMGWPQNCTNCTSNSFFSCVFWDLFLEKTCRRFPNEKIKRWYMTLQILMSFTGWNSDNCFLFLEDPSLQGSTENKAKKIFCVWEKPYALLCRLQVIKMRYDVWLCKVWSFSHSHFQCITQYYSQFYTCNFSQIVLALHTSFS